MRWSAILGRTVFVGAAACSYVFELPADDVTPTVADASIDAMDEGDGPSDATTPSRPPPRDAPAPDPFCASRTSPFLYCADFDDRPAIDLAAMGAVDVSGGQLVLSNAVSLSPPRSLIANVTGADSRAAITRQLGVDPDGISLSFQMLVSTWEASEARLSEIELVGPDVRCAVRLEGTATAWAVSQACRQGETEIDSLYTLSASPIVRGRWQRFGLDISHTPSAVVRLTIDDALVVEVATIAPLARAPAAITLGVQRVASGSVIVFQDDVLVTTPASPEAGTGG